MTRNQNGPKPVRAKRKQRTIHKTIHKTAVALAAGLLSILSLVGSADVYGQTSASAPAGAYNVSCSSAGCIETESSTFLGWRAFDEYWAAQIFPEHFFPSADAVCTQTLPMVDPANASWYAKYVTYVGTVPIANSRIPAYLGFLKCLFTINGQRVDFPLLAYPTYWCPQPPYDPITPARYFTLNYTTKMCERPAQSPYTIILSGPSSVEPWNKKHDKDHIQANLPFVVYVTDSSGAPQANIPVHIRTDVTAQSGGHGHVSARPKGRLVASAKDATNVSSVAGKDTLDGTTDSAGAFWFTFGAEEASGTHTVFAECDPGKCSAPATPIKVDVKIPDLKPLDPIFTLYVFHQYPDGGGIELGAKPDHMQNHYLTKEAIGKLNELAIAYVTQVDYGKQLYLNDASLEWGGVFDIHSTWAPPHTGHRKGVVIDIYAQHRGDSAAHAVPEVLFDDFRKKAAQKSIIAELHCFDASGKLTTGNACLQIQTGLHFHVQLLGVDK